MSAGRIRGPRNSEKQFQPEPAHGRILAFYAVVYDRNLRGKIMIPISRAAFLKGEVRLP